MAHLVVNPFWPLLAAMLAGAWVAFPWMIFNSVAIGSPTQRREILLAIAGLAGSVVITFGILSLRSGELLPVAGIPYALLFLTVFRLATAYVIYLVQSRTFSLFEYYGGIVRSGVIPLVLATLFGNRLVGPLFDALPLLKVAWL